MEGKKKKSRIVILVCLLFVVALCMIGFLVISLWKGKADDASGAKVSKAVENEIEEGSKEPLELPEEEERTEISVEGVCFHLNKVEEMVSPHQAFYDKYRKCEVYLVEREIPESIESFSEVMGTKITVDDLFNEMHYFMNEDDKLCSGTFRYDCIYDEGKGASIYSLEGYVCDDELASNDLQGHIRSEISGVSVDVMYTDNLGAGNDEDESIPRNEFLAVADYEGKYYYYYITGTDSTERYVKAFCKGVYENLVRLTHEQ